MNRLKISQCVAFGLLAWASVAGAATPEGASKAKQEYGPDPASVRRYGPAYRYPQAGWIVLHIEGKPYDRGYQHGRLLAPEIAGYVKTLATKRGADDPAGAWDQVRTLVNALFLRKYDPEYLEEMKGIADGAAAAGADLEGRALDLVDIVAVNSDIEVEFLDSALEATATGLEGKKFKEPNKAVPKAPHPEHCSAFVANGKATKDGSIVFGHITMFALPFVRHFNVWLDVKPEKGHRVLMQTYPGGIQSGMDYYMNDAGMLVAETTIDQTRFDVDGTPLASRIRKALQYGDSIDGVAEVLKTRNNGMYTNEWLLADTKTDEIAMFELGTHSSKLWRSGKDEWFGGTEGFYWGCNNAKDLDVRLETVAALDGKPANLVWRASDRDRTWQDLYEAHKGKIDADFGFLAFTTPPLAAFSSCDAKFTTSAMAKDLKSWALFGNPLGRTWEATAADRARVPDVRPLVSNDWTVLTAVSPPVVELGEEAAAVDLEEADAPEEPTKIAGVLPPAWRGTLLPGDPADTWLVAGFAEYERIVALEAALKAANPDDDDDDDEGPHDPLKEADRMQVDLALFGQLTRYRAAVKRWKDVPLAETKTEVGHDDWFEVAAAKGVLLLHALRDELGATLFDRMMEDFGRDHAGKVATAATFRRYAEKAHGKPLGPIFDAWTARAGLPSTQVKGGTWSVDSFEAEPARALIVYGTSKEKHAQREAAELLQKKIRRRWSNITVPIVSDVDATESELKDRHLLIVGRPDSNVVAARAAKSLPVRFDPASFRVAGATYAHEGSAVIAAGSNPLNPRYSAVIFAGLSAESTWQSVGKLADRERGDSPTEILLLRNDSSPRRLVLSGGDRPEMAAEGGR